MSGDVPRYFPVNFCDRTTGIYAVGAITRLFFTASAQARARRSTSPCSRPWPSSSWATTFTARHSSPLLGPTGYSRILAPERRPYATKDGYVCAVIYNDKHWETFFTLAGKADVFRSTPQYQTHGRPHRSASTNSTASQGKSSGPGPRPTGSDPDGRGHPRRPHALPSNRCCRTPIFSPRISIQVVDHPSEGKIRLMRSPTEWSGNASGDPAPAAPPRGAQPGDPRRAGLQPRGDIGTVRKRGCESRMRRNKKTG